MELDLKEKKNETWFKFTWKWFKIIWICIEKRVPTLISLVVMIFLVITYNKTREEYVKSTRPYVWAINYGVAGDTHDTDIQITHKVALRISNTPAKILRLKVNVFYKNKLLYEGGDSNYVYFPDKDALWTWNIGKGKFAEIMDRPDEDKHYVRRVIYIDYTALDGGKEYHYELHQSFYTEFGRWKGEKEISN